MAAVQVYDFRGNEVRVAEIDGELWFVARDVGRVLELSQPAVSEIAKKLPGNFVRIISIDTNAGLRKHTIFAYEGVVLMLMRSRKPEAEAFQLWLATEVVPSIKKKGYYIAEPKSDTEILAEVAEVTAAAARKLVVQEAQLANHEERITSIENITVEKRAKLWAVERAVEEPAKKTTRLKINELVRAYVDATGLDYKDVWGKIYMDFRYRYNIDLSARARHQKSKGRLDIAEELGVIEQLFLVASQICKW